MSSQSSVLPTISSEIQDKTELISDQETTSSDINATMSTSPNVVYRPVSMDPQGQFEMDRQKEQAYRRNRRKTVNIVIFIVVCLVVTAVISVIIILLSPRHPGTTYEYKMIPTNISAQLTLTRFPDNSSIETDLESAIFTLYNESVFSEVYVKTVVLDITRSQYETDITILMVFTDIGDHLGAPSGSSEDATDVLDLFLISIAEDDFYGFHIAEWRTEEYV